jgi:hypothetical protein
VVVEIEVSLIELASLDTLYDWNGRGGLPGQLHRYAIAIDASSPFICGLSWSPLARRRFVGSP